MTEDLDPVIERKLMLLACYGEVNHEMAINCCSFCADVLEAVLRNGPGNIIALVTINSPGGSLDCAMDIFDRLTSLPCQVVTEISGQASSAAVLVAQAGDWRRMMPHARMMLHLGSIHAKVFSANHREMQKLSRMMREQQRRYNRIIAERCGHYEATVAGWCEREQEFSAIGARTVGLIDEIVQAAPHRRPLKKPRRTRKRKE
jgi:ATP-dependent protease ClpP protease subunit